MELVAWNEMVSSLLAAAVAAAVEDPPEDRADGIQGRVRLRS